MIEQPSRGLPGAIRIDATDVGRGRVGIAVCPGKHDPDDGGTRDLAADLDAIRGWGAAAVVTLLTADELKLLRVPSLGAEVTRQAMTWVHLPITDMTAPDADFERRWRVDGAALRDLLRQGRDVLVHCRGGLGRSGMIAARLLIEFGADPATAIARVRAVRPGAIETRDQENYVLASRA